MEERLSVGSQIIWTVSWPLHSFAPLRLPGIISLVAPDDWFMVMWVDKTGWYDAEAVYELKSLRAAANDEFDRLVDEVRASDWQGFPPPYEPVRQATDFAVGDRVRWAGPSPSETGEVENELTRSLALEGISLSSLTGTVDHVAFNATVRLRWERDDGTFVGFDVVRCDWLAADS